MKPLHYLYFNIYNHFYQRSFNSPEFHARIQAMYLSVMSAGGWILMAQAVYLRIFRHAWFTSKPIAFFFAASVYLLTGLLLNHILITRELDRKIYGKYEGHWEKNPNKRRDFTVSLAVIAAPYAGIALLALFFPRYGH